MTAEPTRPAAELPDLTPLPPDFLELITLRATSIETKLGYFGHQPFIIFTYCPAGAEVLWKDGRSSGFGGGGWRIWFDEILIHAARCALPQPPLCLGDLTGGGTHVLLIDRPRGAVYAAPRASAEAFLAQAYHIPLPTRRCLCAMMGCETCTVRACPFAGVPAPQFTRLAHDKLHALASSLRLR